MAIADFDVKLNQLQAAGFFNSIEIHRGIEKESLRVDSSGCISKTDHPKSLGSPLSNPSITTDFAESLIELVTPTFSSVDDLYEYLLQLHVFVSRNLEGETLWPYSMPPRIENEDSIKLAKYSDTKNGKIKEVYRRGLKERYGSSMQCIAGIHFNFSLSQTSLSFLSNTNEQKDIDEAYLGLIRNFKRYYWFILSVFGASPVVDKTFLNGKSHSLEKFGEENYYLPYSTSLRMSDLGYKSFAQKNMDIRYDSLSEFLAKIRDAILTPYKKFEDIGLKDNKEWLQISTGRLQIENEYYDSIRPKRVGRDGLRPHEVLVSDGIEYVEVRGIDLSPNEPVGISKDQIRLVDLVLLFCIISDSPKINGDEMLQIKQTEKNVVDIGNDKACEVFSNGAKMNISEAKKDITIELEKIAKCMPEKEKYLRALNCITNRNGILKSLNHGEISFSEYGLLTSKLHGSYFDSLSNIDLLSFEEEANASLMNFDKLIKDNIEDIDEFIRSYNKKL